MQAGNSLKNLSVVFSFLCCLLSHSAVLSETDIQYPVTISILKEAYKYELTAHKRYLAFADRATKENYNGVSKLFMALSVSESIHMGNFRRILETLNTPVDSIHSFDIQVGTTQDNLKYALEEELSDIDQRYPKFISQVDPEMHEPSIRDMKYAWQAEMQHRDLIQKIQSAVDLFFGKIEQKLDKAETYYVCPRCGSTIIGLPKQACPICGSIASMYKEVK